MTMFPAPDTSSMVPTPGQRRGALFALSVHFVILVILWPQIGDDLFAPVFLTLVTLFGAGNWALVAWRGRGVTDPLFDLVQRKLPDRWRLKDR